MNIGGWLYVCASFYDKVKANVFIAATKERSLEGSSGK